MESKNFNLDPRKRIQKIQDILINVGVDIARKNEGGLFIISDNCEYKTLLKQKIKPFSVFEEGATKLLLSIAMIDGAVIVNTNGIVVDYGAMIKAKKVFGGHGTRHSAAYSASMVNGTIAILISQEDKKIKIFQKGKLVLQLDALEKNIKKNLQEANHVLESVGFGTFSTIGVTAAASAGLIPFGIAVVPGILLFGAPYYILKKLHEKRQNK